MKRILVLAVLVILILCMAGCSQETPTVPIEVGMSFSDIAEMGLTDSVVRRWSLYHFLYQDGKDFVVGELEIVGSGLTKDFVVKKLTRIRAFEPRKDAYLRLEKGMDVAEMIKILGFPTGQLSGPNGWIFEIDNKLVTVYLDLDDTVIGVTLRENHEIIWHDDFDQEESSKTDDITTIISVAVSAVVVVGSVGILFAQYRRKKKEDIEE